MTLPSTEELQRLLDETPGETWRAELDEDSDSWDVIPARLGGHYSPVAEGLSQPVAELMAESRTLAAEVIRLREGITDAKTKLDHYVDTYHRQGHIYTSARLRDVSEDLTRILEGDQA